MANKRMVNGDIWRDEFVGSLDFFRQVLWIGLIVTCADDQGRMADDMLIRNDVFPRNETVTWAEVSQALADFEKAGRVLRYESGGKKIIQIVNWWRYQSPSWAAPSRYPPPPGWTDKCRYHGKGNEIITMNWSINIPGGFVDSTQSLPSPLPSDDVKSEVKSEVKSDGNGDGGGEDNPPPAENRPNVFTVYEQEIGPLTPVISEELDMAEKEFTTEWVKAALQESSRQSKRSWAYTKAILKRWKTEGRVDTYQQKRGKGQLTVADVTPPPPDAATLNSILEQLTHEGINIT